MTSALPCDFDRQQVEPRHAGFIPGQRSPVLYHDVIGVIANSFERCRAISIATDEPHASAQGRCELPDARQNCLPTVDETARSVFERGADAKRWE
jgi:hypothetical protein